MTCIIKSEKQTQRTSNWSRRTRGSTGKHKKWLIWKANLWWFSMKKTKLRSKSEMWLLSHSSERMRVKVFNQGLLTWRAKCNRKRKTKELRNWKRHKWQRNWPSKKRPSCNWRPACKSSQKSTKKPKKTTEKWSQIGDPHNRYPMQWMVYSSKTLEHIQPWWLISLWVMHKVVNQSQYGQNCLS